MDDPQDTQSTSPPEGRAWRFDRREIAGSLGDLGTLLPIAIGLILVNGIDATALFVCAGLYYILSGLYFRTVVPVQPMKVIGAYAIARALSPLQISLSGLWVGAMLLLLAVTGAITFIGRIIPKPAVRGVQLTTGILLLAQGVRFMTGETVLQKEVHKAAEPFLSVQALGPIPIGIVLGIGSVLLILLLIDSKKAPASLVILCAGSVAGLILGSWRGLPGLHAGLHLPDLFLIHALPDTTEALLTQAALALTVLALPQMPMTVGNAIVAEADLSRKYFGEKVAERKSFRALALSMGLANVATAFFGGMPMCHGAGGLAAHYRYGARTATSNMIIGPLLLTVGVLFGDDTAVLFGMIPLSVLGALLLFAGAQLAIMILDVRDRSGLFVTLTMLGISLVTNLAVGFAVAILLAYALKYTRMKV